MSASDFIRILVEHNWPGGTIVDIIGRKLDSLAADVLTNGKMAREALVDLLKFAFNLLVHYPKVLPFLPFGDFFELTGVPSDK